MDVIPHPLGTLLLNIALIGSLTWYLRGRRPRVCPDCDKRTLIPLRNFWGPEVPARSTRWCASCGALFWRAPGGPWTKERRRTWLDLPWKEPSPGPRKDQPPFDTESRVIAPIIKAQGRFQPPQAEGSPDMAESLVACEGRTAPGGPSIHAGGICCGDRAQG